MNPIDLQAKFATCIALVVLLLIAMVVHGRPAHSASFYPACLKPDGDWVHGLTRDECVRRPPNGLGARWYTNSVLKKARKVW